MRRSRVAFALGVVVPLLVGSGCSDDDPEPKFAPPTTASPSDTGSPSATPTGPVEPTMPAAAKEHTAAGAKAFVCHYVAILNFAERSGETAELRRLSTRKCKACLGYVEAIDSAYDDGGRVEGGQIDIGRLRELPADYGAEWGAFASGHSTPQVIFDGAGGRQRYPGGSFDLYAYTNWTGGRWSMQWMRTPA